MNKLFTLTAVAFFAATSAFAGSFDPAVEDTPVIAPVENTLQTYAAINVGGVTTSGDYVGGVGFLLGRELVEIGNGTFAIEAGISSIDSGIAGSLVAVANFDMFETGNVTWNGGAFAGYTTYDIDKLEFTNNDAMYGLELGAMNGNVGVRLRYDFGDLEALSASLVLKF